MREFINYIESKKENANDDVKLLLTDLIIKAEEAYTKLLWDAVPMSSSSQSSSSQNVTQKNSNEWKNNLVDISHIDNVNMGNLPF